ncbi:hypothetical protein RQP53_15680 [Paucibacter sp. APW11]|uniref:Uncharacterized protein n=1 Tax=Roseateles aquae TaxID=3077235 RepID=A0ABU3PDR7_9BURK|nr:hypothetical protein [Paucibacter sp. APW11]MDT9000716.1 hypothetical protein [Paucibacter sp. APW11]
MLNTQTPSKTDYARALLARPGRELPRPVRTLLILVDGQKTVTELLSLGSALGLDRSALEVLQTQGLISVPDLAAQAREAAERQAAEQARAERAARQAEQARKLVAAKFFALDLATRMLAGREGSLRDGARLADNETSFMAWLETCSAAIASHADAERAQVFRERVVAALR